MKSLLPSQFNTNTKNLILVFCLITIGLQANAHSTSQTVERSTTITTSNYLNGTDIYFYSKSKIGVIEGGNTER